MSSEVTKSELWDARDSILRQMNSGFDRLTERLDLLNGRVGKGEVENAKHELRLMGLERRVYQRRRGDASAKEQGDGRRITERDVRLILAGIAGTLAVLGFFWKLLPALLKVI